MRAPIHPNHTEQMQLTRRKKNVHLWHAGQRQYGPLLLPPLAQSQIEHLQQINFPRRVAAPLAAHRPHAQHLLPFLTSSWHAFSQSSQRLQLQTFKGFYNWIQDGSSNPKSRQDQYVNFHTLSR